MRVRLSLEAEVELTPEQIEVFKQFPGDAEDKLLEQQGTVFMTFPDGRKLNLDIREFEE